MTRTVDDVIDVAIGVLMTAMMLAVGFWCQRYLVNLYSQPVIEKTAPTVQSDALYMEHAITGRDCLLELVINDTFTPNPQKVVFQKCDNPGNTYPITYNANWFSNKEENINKAWTSFFRTGVNYPRTTWELVYKADGVTPDYWLVTLHKTEGCHK